MMLPIALVTLGFRLLWVDHPAHRWRERLPEETVGVYAGIDANGFFRKTFAPTMGGMVHP